MSLRRLVVRFLLILSVALPPGSAAAICGFPGIVVSSIFPAPAGAPDTGFVVLFSPIAPFEANGVFEVPLGTPFGGNAYLTALLGNVRMEPGPGFVVAALPAATPCVGVPLCDLTAPIGPVFCGEAVAVGLLP